MSITYIKFSALASYVCTLSLFAASSPPPDNPGSIQFTAPEPIWWRAPSTNIFDVGQSTDNSAVVNVGQLKHAATQAKSHLTTRLGVTSAEWDAAYAALGATNPFPFSTNSNEENFSIANIGQLKLIAAGFYRVLSKKIPDYSWNQINALGLGAQALSVDRGVMYPWSAAPANENSAPVLVGQMKLVLSFDLDLVPGYGPDSDSDGLPDAWEQFHFGNLNSGANDDPDGDGIVNRHESLMQTNPKLNESTYILLRTNYTYSNIGRIRSVSGPINMTFTFDGEGNLLSVQ